MKAYTVKRHNCDGSTTVFSPSGMYESLYYAYLTNEVSIADRQSMANAVIKWARRKPVGSVYEDDILRVEIFDRD